MTFFVRFCETCQNGHDGSYGSGRFCGDLCAHSKKNRYRISNDIIFVENGIHSPGALKRRIRKDNLIPYICAECGNIGFYNGKPLVLQLDHINGINTDHRLKNLRFLCPNCHTQQETYCSRNLVFQKQSISSLITERKRKRSYKTIWA